MSLHKCIIVRNSSILWISSVSFFSYFTCSHTSFVNGLFWQLQIVLTYPYAYQKIKLGFVRPKIIYSKLVYFNVFLIWRSPNIFYFIKYIPFYTNEICFFFLEKQNPLESNRVLTAIKIGIWKIRSKKRILASKCTSIIYFSEQSKWWKIEITVRIGSAGNTITRAKWKHREKNRRRKQYLCERWREDSYRSRRGQEAWGLRGAQS